MHYFIPTNREVNGAVIRGILNICCCFTNENSHVLVNYVLLRSRKNEIFKPLSFYSHYLDNKLKIIINYRFEELLIKIKADFLMGRKMCVTCSYDLTHCIELLYRFFVPLTKRLLT